MVVNKRKGNQVADCQKRREKFLQIKVRKIRNGAQMCERLTKVYMIIHQRYRLHIRDIDKLSFHEKISCNNRNFCLKFFSFMDFPCAHNNNVDIVDNFAYLAQFLQPDSIMCMSGEKI